MKFNSILLLLLITVLIGSCKTDSTKSTAQATKKAQVDDGLIDNPYPVVPVSFLNQMARETQSLDYFFRGTNFNVSQDSQNAVQSMMSLLSNQKPEKIKKNCFSPCRVTFVTADGILCDLEMYMGPDCDYILYFLDGKPTYSALHTPQGYNFIKNLKAQAEASAPGR